MFRGIPQIAETNFSPHWDSRYRSISKRSGWPTSRRQRIKSLRAILFMLHCGCRGCQRRPTVWAELHFRHDVATTAAATVDVPRVAIVIRLELSVWPRLRRIHPTGGRQCLHRTCLFSELIAAKFHTLFSGSMAYFAHRRANSLRSAISSSFLRCSEW